MGMLSKCQQVLHVKTSIVILVEFVECDMSLDVNTFTLSLIIKTSIVTLGEFVECDMSLDIYTFTLSLTVKTRIVILVEFVEIYSDHMAK